MAICMNPESIFWQTEDMLRLRNAGLLSDEERAAVLTHFRRTFEEYPSAVRELGYRTPQEAVGTAFAERVALLYVDAYEELHARGVAAPKFGAPYIVPWVAEGQHAGEGMPAAAVVTDYLPHDTSGARELQLLSMLAHEIYHTAAPYQVDAHVDEDGLVEIKHLEIGASSRHKVHGHESDTPNFALEEGFAVDFQGLLYERIRARADPNQVALYEQEINQAAVRLPAPENIKSHAFWQAHRQLILLQSVAEDAPFEFSASMEMAEALDLVRLVLKHVPSCAALVEKARVERRSLDLARAIERVFGKGAYNLLTCASLEQAATTRVQLEARLEKQGIQFDVAA